MHVRSQEVFVREVETRRSHLARDHLFWPAKEVLVVRAARRAVVEDECGLTAAARAAASLRVVRRRRRNVAHVDDVEICDIDAELHRGRAEEDGQPRLAKALLARLALLRRHLGGVLARLEPLPVGGDAAVEVDEESVRCGAADRAPRDADRIVEGDRAVAGEPAHGGRDELVARDLALLPRLVHDRHQSGDTQPSSRSRITSSLSPSFSAPSDFCRPRNWPKPPRADMYTLPRYSSPPRRGRG